MRGDFARSAVNIFGLLKVIAILAVIVVLIIVFVGAPLTVDGHSMDPNFQTGEIVLVQRTDLAGTIKRGDVVEAKFPADPTHTKLIKRVIGLPGDTVSFDDTGHYTINGQPLAESYGPIYGQIPAETFSPVALGSNEYFLSGDNRPVSSDSRIWGPVQLSDIQGKVELIIWPFNKLGPANPDY
jgi:signal peptidase I